MTVKILLADKSITIQKVVEMLFSGRDYEVLCVSDGESALSEASRALPDVVLADVDLPKMDGYAFSARLRQTQQLVKIPVILMMSRDDVYDPAKGAAAGIMDHIAKPFESQDLIAKVKRAVAPASPQPAGPAHPAPAQKPAATAPPPPAAAVPKQAAPPDIFEIIQEAPTASEVRQAAGLPGGEEETVYEVEPEVEEVEEPMPREVAKALPVGEKAVEEMRAGLGLEEAEEERAEVVTFESFETVTEAEPQPAAPAPAGVRTEPARAAVAPPTLSEGEIRKMVDESIAKLAKETFESMPLPQPPAISESDLWGIAEEAVSRMAKEVFAQMPPARTAQPPTLPESELRRMAEEAISRMAADAFKDMPPPPLPKISDETVRRGIEDAVMKVAQEIAREIVE